jgi:hypothetical protein
MLSTSTVLSVSTEFAAMPNTNPAPLLAIAGRKRHAAARYDAKAAEYRRQADDIEQVAGQLAVGPERLAGTDQVDGVEP